MISNFEQLPKRPLLVKKSVHGDLRGAHVKLFGETPEFLAIPGLVLSEVFYTENHRNSLRGLHFQVNPPQPKLLSCIRGEAVVNIVNLDSQSEHFQEVTRLELRGAEHLQEGEPALQVFVPPLHGLGYRALEDHTTMLYLAGSPFSGTGDVGLDPFDEELALDWGTDISREKAVLSPRDQHLPSLGEYLEKLRSEDE